MAEPLSSPATAPVPAPANTAGSSPSPNNNRNEISNPFIVGQLVEVESRTWPGINQPGGVGRVTGIAANRVSVRYLVGHTRHEKEIPIRFVKAHAPAAKRLRDRSMLLGRCQNCGSLRTDCGSCDFWAAAEQQQQHTVLPGEKVVSDSIRTAQAKTLETNDDTDSDDSSSSTSSFEQDFARQRRGFQRYQRIKKRALKILADKDDGDESSSSDDKSEYDSSSDEDDDLPLKHLVWQESQSIMARVKRKTHSITSTRAELVRKQQREKKRNQAILDSSSEEDDGEDQRVSPFAAAAAARSRSPSVAQDDKSSTGSVSSPGTPDYSQASPQRTSPGGTTIAPTFNFSDESDDEREALEALEENAASATQNEFIQPEGDARHLPEDMVDRTRHLKYAELAPFFEETAGKLENEKLPEARARVEELENALDGLDAMPEESRNALLKSCETLHDDMIRNVVRDGYDQCQAAMRKLSSNKLYNKHKASLPRHLCDRKLEVRDFRLADLERSVQELMSRVRSVRRAFVSAMNEKELSQTQYDSDGGWVDPDNSSLSPQKSSMDWDGVAAYETDPTAELPPLDRHVHATKKRKRGGMHKMSRQNVERRAKGETTERKTRGNDKSDSQQRERCHSKQNGNWLRGHQTKRQQRRHVDKENDQNNSAGESEIDESESDALSLKNVDIQEADEAVPELNDLLSSQRRGKRRDFANHERDSSLAGKRRQRSETDIATRMERFLEKNNALNIPSYSPASNHDGSSRKAKRRRRSVRKDNTRNDSLGLSADASHTLVHNEGADELQRELLSTLTSRQPARTAGENNDSDHANPSLNIEQICKSINDSFPNSASRGLVSEISRKLSIEKEIGQVALVLKTLVECLRAQGCPTLQELVAEDTSSLRCYVAVYVAILKIVENDLGRDLDPRHGVAFELFSSNRFSNFLDFLLLQLVDSVLSLVHPGAWALKIRNRQRTCHVLDPLRDALAQHLSLNEGVCRCIMKDLGPQSWHHNETRRTVFVSSVDPVSWRAFLTSYQVPRHETKSRFSSFGDVLPDCEIQATWSLLAYFAGPAPCMQENSDTLRWNLVSQLLSRGALLESKSSSGLPPSNDQLKSACVGVRHLACLLSSGSMGGLPRQDLLLVNIVKRSLEIVGDGIFLEDESREALFPTVKNGKVDKGRALSLWRHFDQYAGSSIIPNVSLITDLSKNMLSIPISDIWLEQPALLPSSELARCCLGLVLAWGRMIPSDKLSRQRRFDNAMKALSRNLLDSCQLPEKNEIEQADESDPFQLAFSDKLVPPKAGLPDSRRLLFFQENASYLKICSFLAVTRGSLNGSASRGPDDSDTLAKLCEEIWCIVSDKDMQSRYEQLKSKSAFSAPFEFCGDVLRPYVAAKLCAFLALLDLGVSPINSTSTAPVSFACFSSNTRDTLRHLLLCLLVCFECSSTGESPAIASSIARLIVLVLQNYWRAVEKGELDPAHAKELVEDLNGVVVKCCESIFKAVTSVAFCGVEEEVCAVSVLVLLRFILSVKGCTDGKEQHVAPSATHSRPQNEFSGEDIWGGLDDSVLQALDLDDSVPGKAQLHVDPNPTASTLYSVGRGLLTAMEGAMPSKRYTIVQPTESAEGVALSPQGKILIGRRIEIISETLVIFVAHESFPYESSIDLLQEILDISASLELVESSDDIAYLNQIRLVVSRNLCSLARFSKKASQIVYELKDKILPLFIDSLLDIDILERVPSCSIASIKSRCGSAHEDKMVGEYLKYAKGKSSLRRRLSGLWKFAENLGLAFEAQEHSSSDNRFQVIANYLKGRDPDIDLSVHIEVVQSLELECLERVRCIRGLIDFSRKFSGEQFLRYFTILLQSGLGQLLKIVRLISAENRAGPVNALVTYRQAKLLELLSCFVEVHVSLIGWFFRLGANEMSEDFASLWVIACNEYIAPVLRGDCLQLANCLRRVNELLNSTQPEQTDPPGSVVDRNEAKDFAKMARACMLRRLGQLILPLAVSFGSNYTGSRPSSLLNAILTLGGEGPDNAKRVARCFFVDICSELGPVGETPNSPLTLALDKYFGCLSEQLPVPSAVLFALGSLKQHVMKLLASNLTNESSSKQKKVGGLLILQEIFDLDCMARVNSTNSPHIDLQTLCNIARGTSIVFKAMFVSPCVDNEAIALVFSCVTRLIGLPAACLENQAVGWLPDWCISKATIVTGENTEAATTSLRAKYLITFISWLHTLGKSLSNPTEEILEQLQQCRRSLRSADEESSTYWPRFNGIASSSLADRLSELERRICPDKIQRIRNVYAIARPLQGELEKWKPNPQVQGAIAEFLKKVASSGCIEAHGSEL